MVAEEEAAKEDEAEDVVTKVVAPKDKVKAKSKISANYSQEKKISPLNLGDRI
jgi:hypothetical protein